VSIDRRKTKSGYGYDVRRRTADGRPYKRTFRTKKEAEAYEAGERTARERGTALDPWAGRETLKEYGWGWLTGRPDLRPSTREAYETMLRVHILPALGGVALAELSTARIRAWRSDLTRGGRLGPTTVAKCYRLVKTILNTAVEDGLIGRNPCVIKGASVEHSSERPVATIEQVAALVEAIQPRYRAMVLMATWTAMRYGEPAGLRRRWLDLDAGTVTVVEQLQERRGVYEFGPPKSAAGRRTVSIPPHIVPALAEHVREFVGGDDDLVFTSSWRTPLRRGTFHSRVWSPACEAVGVEGFRFHDLRHTGNTLAASTGASTRELMVRMGHASPRAALIYQHATAERDVAMAQALSGLVDQAEALKTATVGGHRPVLRVLRRDATTERSTSEEAPNLEPADEQASRSVGEMCHECAMGEVPAPAGTDDTPRNQDVYESPRSDSNRRPPAYKAGALTS
jgi:integrase